LPKSLASLVHSPGSHYQWGHWEYFRTLVRLMAIAQRRRQRDDGRHTKGLRRSCPRAVRPQDQTSLARRPTNHENGM